MTVHGFVIAATDPVTEDVITSMDRVLMRNFEQFQKHVEPELDGFTPQILDRDGLRAVGSLLPDQPETDDYIRAWYVDTGV